MKYLYITIVCAILFLPFKQIYAKKILNPCIKSGGPGGEMGSSGIVGSTAGSFSVNSGSFNYSVPIMVSPGINGMQPSLSVEYTNNVFPGIIADKFDVSGLSMISRGGKNLYDDGKYDHIKWHSDDNLFLDGAKLVVYNNNKSPAKVELRLKNNNRLKINAYNWNADGPEYFEVLDESGTIMEYGKASNSRNAAKINSTNITYEWYLNKVRDIYGNTIKYAYTCDSDLTNFRPVQIIYGNDSNLKGFVKFEYENSTISESYVSGVKIVCNKRLKSIKTGYNSAQLRRYKFEYISKDDKILLKKITEYGIDNQTHYNPTVFDWYNAGEKIKTVEDIKLYIKSKGQTCVTGDVNGDGYDDYVTSYNHFISDGKGNYKRELNNIGNIEEGISFMCDINSDGLSDLITKTSVSSTNIFLHLSNGSNFNEKKFLGSTKGSDFLISDLDNNGIYEIVSYQKNSNSNKSVTIYKFKSDNLSIVHKDEYNFSNKIAEVKTGSFYGDGSEQLYVKCDTKISVLSIEGNLRLILKHKRYGIAKSESMYCGDFNGDGITDIFTLNPFSSVSFYLGTGRSFAKNNDFIKIVGAPDFSPSAKIRVADINNDGISDIVNFEAINSSDGPDFLPMAVMPKDSKVHINLNVYLGGDKFTFGGNYSCNENLQNSTDDFFAEPVFGDFNGDGTLEILNVFYQNGDKSKLIDLVSKNLNNQLKSVTNTGGKVNVNYNYLPQFGYDKGSPAKFPLKKINTSLLVVSSVVNEVLSTEKYTTSYTYKGLIHHLQGRGILGFEQIESYQHESKMLGRTKYVIHTPRMIMYPQISETYYKDGTNEEILGRKTTTLSDVDLSSGRFFIYTSNIKNEDILKSTSQHTSIVKDANGNTELTTLVVKDGNTTIYTQVDDMQYDINTSTAWMPGRIKSVLVSKIRPGKPEITEEKEFYYFSNSKLKDVIIEPGHQKQIKTSYLYDGFGNVKSITQNANNDPNIPSNLKSVTETIKYTTDGRFSETITNPLGHKVVNIHNPLTGAVKESKDINNLISTVSFDNMGTPLLHTSADGHSSYSITNFVDVGDSDAPNGAFYISISESSMSKITKVYSDKAGRVLLTVVTKENETRGGKEKVYVDKEYNNMGLLKKESVPHYKNQQGILYTLYTYDKFNRIKTVTSPDGTILTNIYNDDLRTLTVTTSKAGTTTSTNTKYNALGEVYETKNNDGSLVRFSYYSNGLIQRNGVVGNNADIVNTYDIYGNKLTTQTPNGGTTTNVYNAFGRVVSTMDARNLKTSFKYDILGRVKKKIVQNGSTTTFTYDTKWKGALSGISSTDNYSNSYSYDGFGRQKSYTETIAGKTFTTSMQYDNDGRMEKLTYPSGFALYYNYKNNNTHLSSVTYNNGKNLWKCGVQNQYLAYENYTLGTLSPVNLSYDSYGRFTRKHLPAFYDYNVGYDNKGNINKRWDNIYKNSESFLYDDLNRLKNISTYHNNAEVAVRNFTYDNYCNIKEVAGSRLVYNGTNKNRLASIQDNGLNLGYEGLKFDTENNLKQVDNTNFQLNYIYGFDKARRKSNLKQNNQIVKTKYYHSNYEEVTENGKTKQIHYISAPSGFAAIYVKSGRSSKMYFALTDHLGSINTFIDENQKIAEEHAFDSWGKRRDPHNWGRTSSATSSVTDRGFSMHEHLDRFNLINMNGRTYCLNSMQFVSPDPFIQLPDNAANYNRYSYCMNNPINFTDPSGYKLAPVRCSKEPDAAHWLNHIGRNSGGGGSLFPKMGVLGGPTNNLEWDIAFAKNMDMVVGGSLHMNNLRYYVSSTGGLVYNGNGTTSYKYGQLGGAQPIGSNKCYPIYGWYPSDNKGTGYVVDYNKAAQSIVDYYIGLGTWSYFSEKKLLEDSSIGQPGVWESMIPIWGSGRAAVDHFQNGNYWSAAGHTALAISDVFLVKSIVTGVAKGGVKMLGKSYKTWGSYRTNYGKTGFAAPNQQLHHWAWARNGAKSGEGVGWWAKNQMWNLMPMENQAMHTAVHGWGRNAYGPVGRFWYGTPTWFKASIVSGGGRLAN